MGNWHGVGKTVPLYMRESSNVECDFLFCFVFITSPNFKWISSGHFLYVNDFWGEIRTRYGNIIQNFFLKNLKLASNAGLQWDLTNHYSVRLQWKNYFYSVLRGSLLKACIISEQFSRGELFYGKMKQCNIMQIILPLQKGN